MRLWSTERGMRRVDSGTVRRGFIFKERSSFLSRVLKGGWDIHRQVLRKHDLCTQEQQELQILDEIK